MQPCSPSWFRRLNRRRPLILLLFTLPLIAEAQPLDTLQPIRPMFGVGDDEFFIGGWCKVFHPSAFVITNRDSDNPTPPPSAQGGLPAFVAPAGLGENCQYPASPHARCGSASD